MQGYTSAVEIVPLFSERTPVPECMKGLPDFPSTIGKAAGAMLEDGN